MQQSGEPSVEEILDSIKKVIARDVQAAPMQERRTAAFGSAEPAHEDEAAEVLELNEDEIFRDTRDVGLTRRHAEEIDADTRDVGMSREEAAAMDAEEDDNLAVPLPSLDDPQMIDDDGFASDFEPAETELREETPVEDDDDDELVGQVASDRVRADFASLGSAFDSRARDDGDAMGSSLEGMVREMLRPMLAEWLDANLPPIVESIVRAEIERIARR